ncbi:tyrosine-type recombinase/integrase [Halorubrum amylolyticum]|uniref:tyrosine-type recombinase/integrase n=1 Tax=Halorubrum amylolyticum TaxID=2508724 RepID=UPI001008B509|nr:site-specific integrase [Halorubrum amylolyticum]
MEPIEPEAALALYIEDKKRESADSTIRSHRSRLGHFIDWCDETELGNMNDLTARKAHEYRVWRRTERGDPNSVTMKTQMDTFRVFARWCESIDAVPDGLSEKILSPELGKHENERDDMLDPDVGDNVLEHLAKFEYATREHVVHILIWRGLLRRGGIRTLDQQDLVTDTDTPHLKVRHRPETNTPLKKKGDGERRTGLKPGTVEVLQDHIDTHRHDVKDEHDRQPLVTTSRGRPHLQTIQSDSYAATRPCIVSGECPHDQDIDECTAAVNRSRAYECPSSKSPHAVRRGAITRALSLDIPARAIADRASSDVDTLSKHYDRRDEKTRMQQRREYLTGI